MRLAFMGTPEFARVALDALVAAGHAVALVWTQPPRPADRGRLTASPVQRRAEALGIPVRTPLTLRDPAEAAALAASGADVAVVAAYGLLLPRAILATPRHGCLNIHASLLPRWRGAAPVQRAILAGDAETGVTIMCMERGLDTGPMLLRGTTPVGRKTAGALTAELAAMGAQLMLDALARLPALTPVPQPAEGVTLAPRIDKAEARIDWTAEAGAIERLVRAMNPAPGAWFSAGGRRVKLLAAEVAEGAGAPGTVLEGGRIACGAGALLPVRVQAEGRAPMAAADWWRGVRLGSGERLA